MLAGSSLGEEGGEPVVVRRGGSLHDSTVRLEGKGREGKEKSQPQLELNVAYLRPHLVLLRSVIESEVVHPGALQAAQGTSLEKTRSRGEEDKDLVASQLRHLEPFLPSLLARVPVE